MYVRIACPKSHHTNIHIHTYHTCKYMQYRTYMYIHVAVYQCDAVALQLCCSCIAVVLQLCCSCVAMCIHAISYIQTLKTLLHLHHTDTDTDTDTHTDTDTDIRSDTDADADADTNT